jgi:hypothetical protein
LGVISRFNPFQKAKPKNSNAMKNAILFFFVLSLFPLVSEAQASSDSIQLKKVFGGYQFFQNNKRITVSNMVSIMEPNEKAYKQIKEAQSTNVIATIIGGVGGFMLGWQLGTAIAGGDPNWAMAGVGGGLIVVSIPISQKFNRQVKGAVDTYNGGFRGSSMLEYPELNFGTTSTGIGLTFNF